MFYLRLLFLSLLLFTACQKLVNTDEPKNLDYDKAIAFRDSGIADSAYIYFAKAKLIFIEKNDHFRAGKCIVNMSIIAERQGDYFGGQEQAVEALSYFDQKNPDHFNALFSTYNDLGIIAFDLGNYPESVKAFEKAKKFTRNSEDTLMLNSNAARCFAAMGENKKAITLFNQAFLNQPSEDIKARALNNLAYTKFDDDTTYNAIPALNKALDMRLKINQPGPLSDSYLTLTEVYERMNRLSEAQIYAKKALAMAKLYNPDDELKALGFLVRQTTGTESKQYFTRYTQLADSLQTARNKAKNQFAYIRYETEKQKADNLVLQKNNATKNYQLLLAGVVMVFGVGGGTFWYQKRKKTLALKAQNDIRENQLRLSKKVHDVVANGLYRVMSEIENSEKLDKEQLVDRLENMYEKSRDISYENPIDLNNFHEYISTLGNSFSSDLTKVLIVGNSATLWQSVNAVIKQGLEPILQELLVNMKKHSRANTAVLKFENRDKKLHIQYTDNGIGIPRDIEFKNGLNSTGNRIKNLNGQLTFDHEIQNGTKILMEFPLS